jgi:hypothetical protein
MVTSGGTEEPFDHCVLENEIMISSLPFSVRGRHRRAVPVAVRIGVGLMVAAIWPAGLVQSDPPSGDDQAPPAGLIRFEDRQPISGIGFVLDNSTTPDKQIIDSMLGGLAVFDFDNDGLLDIFFTNGAKIPGLVKDDPRFWNRLYRNQGDGTFRDVTDHAGVQGEGYSMGVAAGDFDNDGLTDLYVTGVNRNILYRNRGDGRFADVTETAGVSGTIGDTKPWSVGSAWLDYDNDGDLDLFVVNYNDWTAENNRLCGVEGKRLSCSPTYYKKLPNLLYRNEGGGKFLDVSAAAGISGSMGYGMSLAVADADGDGFIDVFVANDQIRQFLFRNVRGRRFVEVGVETGAALTEDGVPFSGMGSEFRDLGHDGRPDIFVTALAGEAFPLFLNSAEGYFVPSTHAAGLGFATVMMSGWGAGAFDFDNDGSKDIFIASSNVSENIGQYSHYRYRMANVVLKGSLDGRFSNVSAEAGHAMKPTRAHRGAAFGDLDNDGRIDVVVAAIGEPPAVLYNVSSGGHWLVLRLKGTSSNRNGLGARVKVTGASGHVQHNHATTSVGYNSSSDRRVHFGLGADTAVREIEIRWPGGATQVLKNVAADQILEVTEP